MEARNFLCVTHPTKAVKILQIEHCEKRQFQQKSPVSNRKVQFPIEKYNFQ